jgi:drug/metabolite transporter (DMT)-like permease
MRTPSSPPPAAPSAATAPTSVYREASVFIAWGALIILLAHGVEVSHAGRPNWPALAIRVAWVVVLLVAAQLFRQARRPLILAGVAVGIFGSALLDLAILRVTGGSSSPLLAFTPVLATVLPFLALEAIWMGLAGSTVLLAGTWLIQRADGAPPSALIAFANAGGGALACGWLLARAFERSRRAEERRQAELAEAMASIKTLKGLLPVCAWCRRVRSDAGYWQQLEAYVTARSDATFTHALCHDCAQKHFPGLDEEHEPGSQQGA